MVYVFFAIAPVIIYHLAERIQRNMQARGMNPLDSDFFNYIPSGKLGVHIFFVISGFVIAMPLIKTWVSGTEVSFDFKKYFIRRLTRLETSLSFGTYSWFFWLSFFVQLFGSTQNGN